MKRIITMAAVLCLGMAMVAGCAKRSEPQIIGTKQAETEESNQKNGAGGGEDGQGSGAEGSQGSGAGDSSENGAGGDSESGFSMVNPPKTYQTEFTTDFFSVTADADVTMPGQGIVKGTYGIKKNISQEVFENVNQVLSDTFGITWNEYVEQNDREEETQKTLTDQTGNYKMTYHTLSDPESNKAQVSFLWCINLGKVQNWGSSENMHNYDISDLAVSEKRQTASDLDTKTENLLKNMGLSDYQKRKSRWSYRTYSKKKEGAYFYQITYTPVWSEIPFVSERSFLGDVNVTGPYLQVVYGEDGTLEQFKLIDAYREEPSQPADQPFLLPFQSVGELFEQYVKDYEGEPSEEFQEMESALMPGAQAAVGEPDNKQDLQVTKVALEYAWIGENGRLEQEDDVSEFREEAGSSTEKAEEKKAAAIRYQLVPVWSFYGRIDSGAEKLLLSIRADDGQALTR